MDERLILRKFGNRYIADETTYKMGIDMRLARHLAARFKGRTVLETCTGGGFSAIPISKYAERIYTFETDGARLEAARKNAVLSRADRKITFIHHDVTAYDLASLPETIDAAFIDPDWADGGPEHAYRFIGSATRPPSDTLLERVLAVTPNVTLVQPPLIDPAEFAGLPPHELERLYLGGSFELFCLHFGELANAVGETEYRVR